MGKDSYYSESQRLEMKIAREAKQAKWLLTGTFVVLAADIAFIVIYSLKLTGKL